MQTNTQTRCKSKLEVIQREGDESWGYIRETTDELIITTTWYEIKSPYFRREVNASEAQV